MFKKLADYFLILLVLIYILFEELVWEKTAKPIVRFISKFVLKFDIFEKLILKIDNLGSYWILSIFIVLFLFVELLGIYAAILFFQAKIFLAIFVYLLKLPLAIFILWFFDITKDKLMQFRWFSYLYKKLIVIIELIKNSKIYNLVHEKIANIKIYFKEKSLLKANSILNKFINIYKNIRARLGL